MRSLCFLLIGMSAAWAFSAFAFERPFPEGTRRGKMTPAAYPTVVIDGKTRTLSAGARIWNQNNTIDMPASIGGSNLVVNYTENAQGAIDRVWILTQEEARRSAKK